MTEMIGYRYHARELQITAIRQQTDHFLQQELQAAAESVEALFFLPSTPPIVLPLVMKNIAGSEEAFLNLVYPAVLANLRRDFVLGTLERLVSACATDSRGFKEVSIDQYARIVPSPFRLALKNNTDILMDLIEESDSQGTTALLEALQGDIPLLRYRRDVVEVRLNLSQSIDGGNIGYLRTKVPSVDLKLWYPREEKLPRLSFTVDDITSAALNLNTNFRER